MQISDAARLIEQAQQLPEVRQDRVDAIRAQIAQGTYETPTSSTWRSRGCWTRSGKLLRHVEELLARSVRVQLPPVERFGEFLQGRGKRLTAQRRLIVEQVFSHHDHFDADELMDHLQRLMAQRKLSRPTIYRTLAELVEAGMLRKMSSAAAGHLRAPVRLPQPRPPLLPGLQRLIEFHSAELERIRDEVARQQHFEVVGHRMFVIGICTDCRGKSDS